MAATLPLLATCVQIIRAVVGVPSRLEALSMAPLPANVNRRTRCYRYYQYDRHAAYCRACPTVVTLGILPEGLKLQSLRNARNVPRAMPHAKRQSLCCTIRG